MKYAYGGDYSLAKVREIMLIVLYINFGDGWPLECNTL